jgi:hypothetical protein
MGRDTDEAERVYALVERCNSSLDRRMREGVGQEVRVVSGSAMNFRSSKESSRPVNQKSYRCVPATQGGDPTKGLPRCVDINEDSRAQCAVELQLLWWMAGGGTARSERRTERASMVLQNVALSVEVQ